MSDVDRQRVDEIFSAALLRNGSERDAFIEAQCGGDVHLLQRVRQLLAASATSDDPLGGLVGASRNFLLESIIGADPDSGEDLSGNCIGNWRIEKPLARGGLATVYIASRNDGHYEQRAAFKVLRRGLDTDDVIARFRTERQILSSMEHPAIAQMLDGGTLDDGRPYLVLEYVDGLSVTEYCDANKIGVRGRVTLVIDMLKALQHAHRYLVVHRDIKPSNVLVSQDGRIKLLDFGIAKLLDPTAIPGGSTLTRTGVVLLTPVYGSPEQHSGQPVTTASDIYQAGGVLYELLAGKRPPSGATLTEHTVSVPPSQAVKGKSAHRKIKGDLDAIVSKAMQLNPSLRYATATDMVADLERYLDGRPVHAQPDTFAYRFYKFFRRRPLLLPIAVIIVSVAVAYIVILNNHNREVRIEQQRAQAAQAFMVDLLGSADPYGPTDRDRGRDILVADALDIGLERLRTERYGSDDKLRAALMTSIADVYGNLDRHEAAIQTRLEALALERVLYGDVSEPVMLSLRALARQYRTVGLYDEAAPYYDEQLFIARQLYAEEHPQQGLARRASGLYQFRRGNTDVARELLEAAVRILKHAGRDHAADYVGAVVTLARVRKDDLLAESLTTLVEAMHLADSVYGADSPTAGLTRTQYATSLTLAGKYAEAERYFEEAIRIYEAKLGRDHGATLIALINLGRLYYATGDFANAEIVHREVFGHYLRKYGPRQGGVAESAAELGNALSAQARYEEAIEYHRQAYESSQAVLGDEQPRIYVPLLMLARAQMRTGALAEAAGNLNHALEKLAEIQPGGELERQAQCLWDESQRISSPADRIASSDHLCPTGDD